MPLIWLVNFVVFWEAVFCALSVTSRKKARISFIQFGYEYGVLIRVYSV